MAEPGLESRGLPPARKLRATGLDGGGIVGMAQLADMHGGEFGFAPAEQRGPSWIDAEQVAFERGDAEQVLGYLPDAVALARPLRDLALEPVGEMPQHFFLAYPHRGFEYGDQYPADTGRGARVGDGAVADGEIGLFRNALALDQPGMIFGEEAGTFAAQDRFSEGAEVVP